MDRYFAGYWEQLGLSRDEFLRLGETPESPTWIDMCFAWTVTIGRRGIGRAINPVRVELQYLLFPATTGLKTTLPVDNRVSFLVFYSCTC